MKVISLVSQKGGVGKTTVALNLAYAFAKAGRRTVLVDVDPQGAVGHSLPRAPTSGGLVAFLTGQARAAEVVVTTRVETFRLLPFGALQAADTQRFGDFVADGSELRRLCAELAASHDVVLFDTPCGFGGATVGAMRASDAVVSPLQAEPIAIRTLPQLLETVAKLRSEGFGVQLAGILLTMLQLRDEVSLDVAQDAWSRLPDKLVFETTIPRDPAFLQASSAGVPVALLRQRHPPAVARVFDRLVDELEERLEGQKDGGADEPYDLFA